METAVRGDRQQTQVSLLHARFKPSQRFFVVTQSQIHRGDVDGRLARKPK